MLIEFKRTCLNEFLLPKYTIIYNSNTDNRIYVVLTVLTVKDRATTHSDII